MHLKGIRVRLNGVNATMKTAQNFVDAVGLVVATVGLVLPVESQHKVFLLDVAQDNGDPPERSEWRAVSHEDYQTLFASDDEADDFEQDMHNLADLNPDLVPQSVLDVMADKDFYDAHEYWSFLIQEAVRAAQP